MLVELRRCFLRVLEEKRYLAQLRYANVKNLHSNADYSCIGHSRMFKEKCLEFCRGNLVTFHLDEFLSWKSLADISSFTQSDFTGYTIPSCDQR